jgi:hypothetical protein
LSKGSSHESARDVADAVVNAFERAEFTRPTTFLVAPSGGVTRHA